MDSLHEEDYIMVSNWKDKVQRPHTCQNSKKLVSLLKLWLFDALALQI